MANLSLRHINKVYQGGVKAVSDFNLEIDDKEFVVFVGPSGCGKSTTLRMIAGLEEITDGELYIDDRLVNDVEPKDRDIAMVFQNYALYPHMTVYDNMAFGLKLRRMPMAEIDARVKEAAAILGIEALLTRKPKALSGGQRQRVALGRAIVREPKVFLLDEPLSNLDAKLRTQMRTEITKLHHKLATTFIYVTHDQTEAMTMGTRIVVMKDGLMQQVDSPQNLYDYPCNLFVAGFIGTPQMNFFKATLVQGDRGLEIKFGNNTILIPESKAKRLVDESYIGQEVIFGVRPEDIHDEEIFINANPDTTIMAEIDVMEKLGSETMLYMKVDGKEENVIARVDARTKVNLGETLKLAIDAKHIHLFDKDTELAILGASTHNFMPAKLIAGKNGLIARIGKTKLELPPETESRISDREYINDSIVAGIRPSDVTFDADKIAESRAVLSGTVDFVEKFPRETLVYINIEGKDRLFVARAESGADFKQGSKIKFAVTDLEIFDLNRDRLRVKEAVPFVNVIKAVANVTNTKTGGTIVDYTIGKSKITLPENAGNANATGNVNIWISPSEIFIDKNDVHSHAGTALRGVVNSIDRVRGEVFLFVVVDGIEEQFVIRTKEFAGEPGAKVKFALNPMSIGTGTEIPTPPEPKEFVDVLVEEAVAEDKAESATEEKEKAKPAAKKPAAKKTTAKKS